MGAADPQCCCLSLLPSFRGARSPAKRIPRQRSLASKKEGACGWGGKTWPLGYERERAHASSSNPAEAGKTVRRLFALYRKFRLRAPGQGGGLTALGFQHESAATDGEWASSAAAKSFSRGATSTKTAVETRFYSGSKFAPQGPASTPGQHPALIDPEDLGPPCGNQLATKRERPSDAKADCSRAEACWRVLLMDCAGVNRLTPSHAVKKRADAIATTFFRWPPDGQRAGKRITLKAGDCQPQEIEDAVIRGPGRRN